MKPDSIAITDFGENGCRVSFPYDKTTLASLKETFPKAKWSGLHKLWVIPGKLAYRRAVAWKDALEVQRAAADKAREQEFRAAEFEGRLDQVDPAAALAKRRGEFTSSLIGIYQNRVGYAFTYDAECVELAKASGAFYSADSKTWTWIAETIADVGKIIDAANGIHLIQAALLKRAAALQAVRDAERKAERAAQEAERAAYQAARDKARANRFVALADKAPRPGATVRYGRAVVSVLSLGKTFRGGDDLSSMGGPVGAEGEWVRYVYFRPAEPGEIADLEAREAANKAASERAKARSDALYALSRSADAPELGAEPAGKVVWRDDTHAITGYARRVILTDDGWLWLITYDGTDGGGWGDYNCGYNTRGARLPATPELLAAISD